MSDEEGHFMIVGFGYDCAHCEESSSETLGLFSTLSEAIRERRRLAEDPDYDWVEVFNVEQWIMDKRDCMFVDHHRRTKRGSN